MTYPYKNKLDIPMTNLTFSDEKDEEKDKFVPCEKCLPFWVV